MKKEILFTDGNYTIQKQPGVPEDALLFLDSISWGNEGAIYEHKDTQEHIKYLHNPMMITINEGDAIRGTAAFCNTNITTKGTDLNCFYIRYFASSKEIRGKGVMKHFSKKVMELIRENDTKKTVYFACIESANKGSYKVVESAGYKNIGTVKTIGFSRYFPKLSKNIAQITTESEKKEVLSLLKGFYNNHFLVQFNAIFLHNNYFVLRENNEIIAGCQYHKVHWAINAMKGFSGKIIMNVVPHIPILNKLFNPKRFEFLAFEGIYFKSGYEHKLHELFEGLLAKENLKSSMFWMGETCPVKKDILKKGNLGLIHTFLKDSDVKIMASFQNLSETEILELEASPLFASAFDYI